MTNFDARKVDLGPSIGLSNVVDGADLRAKDRVACPVHRYIPTVSVSSWVGSQWALLIFRPLLVAIERRSSLSARRVTDGHGGNALSGAPFVCRWLRIGL